MKRSEILANREKWVNFLLVKGRKKAIAALDIGEGHRCCLGHACYILGVAKQKVKDSQHYTYGESFESGFAPSELLSLVGLWDTQGSTEKFYESFESSGVMSHFNSLADANDSSTIVVTPPRDWALPSDRS